MIKSSTFRLSCLALAVATIMFLVFRQNVGLRQGASSSHRALLREAAWPQPRVETNAFVSTTALTQSENANTSLKTLCFVRGQWIYIMDVPTGKITKVGKGVQTHLSPNGNRLVFVSTKDDPMPTVESMKQAKVKMFDPSSNTVRTVPSLDNLGALQPKLSSDASKMAFLIANPDGGRVDVGILDIATGDWRNITQNIGFSRDEVGPTLDSWVPGDTSVLFHTMTSLYEVSLDGELLRRIPFELLRAEYATNPEDFSFSKDKKFLLFYGLVSTDELPINETIFVLDLAKNITRRVTPKTLEARDPIWLSSDEILFTCLDIDGRKINTNICKMKIGGSEETILVTDARNPSFATR